MSEPGTPSPSGWRTRLQETAIYRSVVRSPAADSPRGRAQRSFGNVFLHVYPVRVPRALLRFRSTWRLGFITTVLLTFLLITGVSLMFFYTPSVRLPYGDMPLLR